MTIKYNKKVITSYSKFIDGERFSVYVLDDNEYYNIHVISESYKQDEMNTLKLQEPKESVNLEYFTNARLITYLMEHFIWDRFYNEFQENDLQISCDVCS